MSRTTDELRRIAAAHDGLLRPEDVVEEAEPVTSPLHPYFQWDDTEAARLYRLRQAQDLIRVSVIVVGTDDPPTMTRCFVSLTPDRHSEGGYRDVMTVLQDTERRSQLLDDALKELESFRRKYKHLQELQGVFDAMRELVTTTAVA